MIMTSNPPESKMPTMGRDFQMFTSEIDTDATLGPGDLLLETIYISVDAYSALNLSN